MAVLKEIAFYWNDDPETILHATVSVDEDWNTYPDPNEEDDHIFYYFAHPKELEEAKTGKGYEFTVVSVEEED